jgi:hypothetical protein
VANIPVFGNDPVFGVIGEHVFQSWPPDDGSPQRYGTLPCDARGWPLHGHLICASWRWWQAQFETAGLRREFQVEQTLNSVYGAIFRSYSLARSSIFVFRRHDSPATDQTFVDELGRSPSAFAN